MSESPICWKCTQNEKRITALEAEVRSLKGEGKELREKNARLCEALKAAEEALEPFADWWYNKTPHAIKDRLRFSDLIRAVAALAKIREIK